MFLNAIRANTSLVQELKNVAFTREGTSILIPGNNALHKAVFVEGLVIDYNFLSNHLFYGALTFELLSEKSTITAWSNSTFTVTSDSADLTRRRSETARFLSIGNHASRAFIRPWNDIQGNAVRGVVHSIDRPLIRVPEQPLLESPPDKVDQDKSAFGISTSHLLVLCVVLGAILLLACILAKCLWCRGRRNKKRPQSSTIAGSRYIDMTASPMSRQSPQYEQVLSPTVFKPAVPVPKKKRKSKAEKKLQRRTLVNDAYKTGSSISMGVSRGGSSVALSPWKPTWKPRERSMHARTTAVEDDDYLRVDDERPISKIPPASKRVPSSEVISTDDDPLDKIFAALNLGSAENVLTGAESSQQMRIGYLRKRLPRVCAQFDLNGDGWVAPKEILRRLDQNSSSLVTGLEVLRIVRAVRAENPMPFRLAHDADTDVSGWTCGSPSDPHQNYGQVEAANRAVTSAVRSKQRRESRRSKQQDREATRLGSKPPLHGASIAASAVREDDGLKLNGGAVKSASRRLSPWDHTAIASKHIRAPPGLDSMLSKHMSGSQISIRAASPTSPIPFDKAAAQSHGISWGQTAAADQLPGQDQPNFSLVGRRGSGDEYIAVDSAKPEQKRGRKPSKFGRRGSSEHSDQVSNLGSNSGDAKRGRRQSQHEAKRQSREAQRLSPSKEFLTSDDEYLTLGGKAASGAPALRGVWMSSPPEDVLPVHNFISQDGGIDPLEILFGEDVRDFETSDLQVTRNDLIRAARSQSTSPIKPLPLREGIGPQHQQPQWAGSHLRTQSAIGPVSIDRSPPTVQLQPFDRFSPIRASGREFELDLARSRLRPSRHYQPNQHAYNHQNRFGDGYFDVGESPYRMLGPSPIGDQ